jgi:hypothetical protein
MVACASRRSGASRLGCLIQLIILGAIVYFAFLASEDMLKYYSFRDAMKQEARFANLRNDAQIKDRLRAFADTSGLPLGAQDVKIVREGDVIRLWSDYDQTFHFPFKVERTVHLRPSVEKRL